MQAVFITLITVLFAGASLVAGCGLVTVVFAQLKQPAVTYACTALGIGLIVLGLYLIATV